MEIYENDMNNTLRNVLQKYICWLCPAFHNYEETSNVSYIIYCGIVFGHAFVSSFSALLLHVFELIKFECCRRTKGNNQYSCVVIDTLLINHAW